jgi:N-acyl-D-amino-acid deacylase
VLDVLIVGGEVHDGSGAEPVKADVGVAGDRIVMIRPPGEIDPAGAARLIDAASMVVCPGFINILSHSYFSILTDPRSLGELAQGVTTQIFGEGSSMGPLTPDMRASMAESRDGDYEVCWNRLGEYLQHVEQRGAAQNVASYIGAGTLRANVVGYTERPATAAEIDAMQGLVAEEMADGALGIGSSLIYPPGSYASAAELTALCTAAAAYGGRYASHVRDEGAGLLEATAEFVTICRDAGLPGEHWHLKAAGAGNWHLMDGAIACLPACECGWRRAAGVAWAAPVDTSRPSRKLKWRPPPYRSEGSTCLAAAATPLSGLARSAMSGWNADHDGSAVARAARLALPAADG